MHLSTMSEIAAEMKQSVLCPLVMELEIMIWFYSKESLAK